METSKTSRKERLEEVMNVFIIRRIEDSQVRYPAPEILRGRAESYEQHLSNMEINPADYNKVYELALQYYNENEIKGPFGIDEIIQGAKRFQTQNVPVPYFVKEEKQKITCDTCHGTGLRFDDLGKIIYEETEGKKKALKCEDCYVS